jgi:peptidoglycan/LPS O-acetylase OafA/YrhL
MKKVIYREDIDALRGIAVLLVVIYHSFPDSLPGGFIGVDIFFVISGYLITSIILKSLQQNDFTLSEFYARRIRRLFPSLITVLIFVLVIGWLVLFPEEYKQLGDHISNSVIFVLNFTLIDEANYFDVASHYKPLLHLWTLSVEEQYYLLWPIMLLIFLKLNSKPLYLFSIVFILSLFANLYFIKDYTQETYYHTLSRFWQLSTGSLLAVTLLNKQIGSNRILLVLGVIVIFLSAFMISSEVLYPGYWALLPVIGASLLIVANSQLPTYLGLSKIGLISYPLYLWHWVLISMLYIYLGRRPGFIPMVLAVILSFIVSYLTYKYIEKLRYNANSTPYLVVSLVIVGLVGLFIHKYQGMPERGNIAYFEGAAVQFKRTAQKDDECIQYSNALLDEEHIFNYCRSANLGKDRIVAIIGDSHASVLFTGIAKEALDYGFGTILLANSSCPPLKGFLWGKNPKEVSECKRKIDQIIKILTLDKRIEKVVFSTRGPVYINGEVKGEFTHKSVEDSLSFLKQEDLTYGAYFKGFENTIQEVSAIQHVNKIFYLLENPELDFLPKETIPRPFDYFNVSTNRNHMTRDLYLKRMRVYREGLEKLTLNKLSFLDPIDFMCDESKCFSFLDGNFLYADDDHFSRFGSRYIAEKFREMIFER